MSSASESDILARLVRKGETDDAQSDPWGALAASEPSHEVDSQSAADGDAKLDGLLQRISQLTGEGEGIPGGVAAHGVAAVEEADEPFWPREPRSVGEVGLSESEIEALVLKLLLSRGDLVGRDMADHIRLPFALIEEILRQMKQDQLVVYRGSARDERLSVPADRYGPRASATPGRALQLFRLGPGHAGCLHRARAQLSRSRISIRPKKTCVGRLTTC